MKKPIVWTIAGSDSGGFAGIQADLKTFHALGVHGCSIVTAVTAQNRHEITSTHFLPEEHIQSQIETLLKDLPPTAIKIGMLGHLSHSVFDKFKHAKIIFDPLLSSTGGHALYENSLVNHIKNFEKFYPHVDILTPNIFEAEKILGISIQSLQDIENAAHQFLQFNIKNVLIKGGHFDDPDWVHDYWTNGQESFWLSHERIRDKNFHGTGCTLSSAITGALGLGYDIKDAIVIAKMTVTQSIQKSEVYGLAYPGWPSEMNSLPYLGAKPLEKKPNKFTKCETKLGLYPVVDSADWISKLLPLGITTIQLRIKNLSGFALEKEIQKAIQIANAYNARLFINDYWEYAIKYNAYGVHLGQEDLKDADMMALHTANIRLGISTHSYYEVARAHTFQPSYIAFGPIYHTTSKIMPFAPQGITKLQYFNELLDYPLVAIGGINEKNLTHVQNTGVSGIAMISAITAKKDPLHATHHLLKMMSA